MSSSEARKRTGRLPAIRCFEDEEKRVRGLAEQCGMSVGQFLLATALDRQVDTLRLMHVRNELRRLGGLQKHLFNEGRGMLSKEYAEILVQIRDAVARLGG